MPAFHFGPAALMQKLLVLAILCLTSQPVFAYIDPGTGSALIQGLIAAIAAVGVTAKLYWHRLRAAFGTSPMKEEAQAAKQDVQDETE